MLSCRELVEQSSDYVDKQLSFRQRMNVRMHIMLCSVCRRYVRHMGIVVKMFGEKDLPAEQHEVDKVMDSLQFKESEQPENSKSQED